MRMGRRRRRVRLLVRRRWERYVQFLKSGPPWIMLESEVLNLRSRCRRIFGWVSRSRRCGRMNWIWGLLRKSSEWWNDGYIIGKTFIRWGLLIKLHYLSICYWRLHRSMLQVHARAWSLNHLPRSPCLSFGILHGCSLTYFHRSGADSFYLHLNIKEKWLSFSSISDQMRNCHATSFIVCHFATLHSCCKWHLKRSLSLGTRRHPYIHPLHSCISEFSLGILKHITLWRSLHATLMFSSHQPL